MIFSGGEPLFRKDLHFDACPNTATTYGIIPAMLSNGLLITPQVALQLKDAGIKAIGIPID